MRSRQRRLSDEDLRRLVRRILRCNRAACSEPVIIARATQGKRTAIAVGRVLHHQEGCLQALVDTELKLNEVTTLFLTDQVYLGKVVNCVTDGNKFAVKLLLIQRWG